MFAPCDESAKEAGARGVQRQPAGHFAAPGGDAGAAGHRAHGGRALRQQADLLPGSACQGAASGAVRREKD